MSQTCFCPEEAAYCESLVDVWVWFDEEYMYMPEPGCQRLVDAEKALCEELTLGIDEDGDMRWYHPWWKADSMPPMAALDDDELPF